VIEDLISAFGVACHSVRGTDPTAILFPEETRDLGVVAPSRLREFAQGRTCARRALRKLGQPGAPILRGAGREPVWPPGIVGSITHCSNYCAAAVARRAEILTIGIDAEPARPLAAANARVVCTPFELAWLERFSDGPRWGTVVFSAKESAYKAWFPLTRRRVGFQDASVEIHPSRETFTVRTRLLDADAAGCDLSTLEGRYAIRDGLVLTVVVKTHKARSRT
jgi:4'-phosphopantetheinyl transferase EntD